MRGLSALRAFQRNGNTAKFTAGVAAPTAVQVSQGTSTDFQQYEFTNIGNVDAFIGDGPDAATAGTNSVIPTGAGANAKPVVVVPARSSKVYSFPTNWFFTGITAAGTADIHVTPGRGV